MISMSARVCKNGVGLKKKLLSLIEKYIRSSNRDDTSKRTTECISPRQEDRDLKKNQISIGNEVSECSNCQVGKGFH